jgi:trk system potassium uptake protein TrkA
MAEFAVIGAGRFGRAVARALARERQSVLVIDRDGARLQRIAPDVDSILQADTTREPEVAALRLDRLTAVVVAIGSRATEASLLTVAILKELAVPQIVARAFDRRHARLLLALGATEVMIPEDEVGERLATRLAQPAVLEHIRFADAEIAEVATPEALVGPTLRELDLRGRYSLTLLAIRSGETTRVNPGPDDRLKSGDVVVVLGQRESIAAVAALR